MRKSTGKKRDIGEISYSPVKKESLTFSELQRLLDVCDDLEDLTLIQIGVTCGIRRSDIVNIEIMNLDFERHVVKFWEEKKDRVWLCALEPETEVTIKRYINSFSKDRKYLFDFSDKTAYNKLQRLKQKAKINKRIEFHALRRTMIRLSKKLGRDPRWVMDQTGDTARTILEEYEGYSPDEMVDYIKDDGILKRAMREKPSQ